ncbi:hypothetical protein [Neptuniibacter sp. CAU 1671]|uniref:hypothetical protein n=1 Tax=Neptuniibacter sp. CAU 1671 TaxID=3032593 RepID=UPI0023DC745F|nr:hypothetical protein [Neptuniibacter sp. CAU 1671]MDF2181953.1 hypothetical protein [Neptuniibacter sp. CAU 1671]
MGEIKLHGDRLYYADVEKKSIFVMDIASGTVKERFKLESRPDRFWLSNRHNLLYVLSYASSLISVYSLEQNALLSQIPVGDFRGEILFDEKDDRLYLALADQSVQVIDTSLFRSEGVVNMNRDSDILHVDAVDKQVWLRQHNNQIITVVDLKTGRVIKHYGIDQ